VTESLRSFFAMGGYAVFVWPAYALAVAVLAGLLIGSLRQLRRAQAELAAQRGGRPESRR